MPFQVSGCVWASPWLGWSCFYLWCHWYNVSGSELSSSLFCFQSFAGYIECTQFFYVFQFTLSCLTNLSIFGLVYVICISMIRQRSTWLNLIRSCSLMALFSNSIIHDLVYFVCTSLKNSLQIQKTLISFLEKNLKSNFDEMKSQSKLSSIMSLKSNFP